MSEEQHSTPSGGEHQSWQPRFPVLKGGTIINYIRLLENLTNNQREELYRHGVTMRNKNRDPINRSQNRGQHDSPNNVANRGQRVPRGGPRNTRRPPEERRRGNTNPHRRTRKEHPAPTEPVQETVQEQESVQDQEPVRKEPEQKSVQESEQVEQSPESQKGKMTFKQKLTQNSE